MYNLFCEMWMQELASLWNNNQLEKINNTNMNIGYGFIGSELPLGVLIISDSKATTELYVGQNLDLDVRADIMDWQNWLTSEFTLSQLGMLIVHNRLQFNGNNSQKILKIPSFATIFFHSFKLMNKIPTKF
ncbi:hypothetical protein QUF74_07000 [Candidatus Halobeggiatoa sp. HSG11]|nr:hypothetical protein [Candidatus Halobeggiatoa sp. HSG11]